MPTGPPAPYPYVGGAVGAGRHPFNAKYANGKPPAFLARGHVKHIKVKGKKGKKSKKETYDLIVNIDLVSFLNDKQSTYSPLQKNSPFAEFEEISLAVG